MGNMLSTADIRRITGWSLPRIRSLCASQKLPAVDTSAGSVKPRWEVREEDLEEFLTPKSKRASAVRRATRTRPIDANVQKVFG